MTRRAVRADWRVLMVCTGNICRSPTAEAVLRHKAWGHHLGLHIEVESAGISGYHTGEPPDRRSQAHALLRGYDLSEQRARPVCADDFLQFDWILAMDSEHLASLRHRCPPSAGAKLGRLMEFAAGHWPRDIEDPYYGGAAGFERVLDEVEAGCEGLLMHLLQARRNR